MSWIDYRGIVDRLVSSSDHNPRAVPLRPCKRISTIRPQYKEMAKRRRMFDYITKLTPRPQFLLTWYLGDRFELHKLGTALQERIIF